MLRVNASCVWAPPEIFLTLPLDVANDAEPVKVDAEAGKTTEYGDTLVSCRLMDKMATTHLSRWTTSCTGSHLPQHLRQILRQHQARTRHIQKG